MDQIPFHSPQKESTLPAHLHLVLLASELWDNELLLFKPPSLWHFVTAALANNAPLLSENFDC